MKLTNKIFNHLRQEECGATSIEYAVIIGLLVLLCFAAIGQVGDSTSATWNSNSQQIAEAMNN